MSEPEKVTNITPEAPDPEKPLEDTPRRRKLIKKKIDEIQKLKSERKSINDRIKACFEECEAQGVNREAVKYTIKRLEMGEEKRTKLDESTALCLKAVGVGFQPELFEDK